jgi:hypothetical protein
MRSVWTYVNQEGFRPGTHPLEQMPYDTVTCGRHDRQECGLGKNRNREGHLNKPVSDGTAECGTAEYIPRNIRRRCQGVCDWVDGLLLEP